MLLKLPNEMTICRQCYSVKCQNSIRIYSYCAIVCVLCSPHALFAAGTTKNNLDEETPTTVSIRFHCEWTVDSVLTAKLTHESHTHSVFLCRWEHLVEDWILFSFFFLILSSHLVNWGKYTHFSRERCANWICGNCLWKTAVDISIVWERDSKLIYFFFARLRAIVTTTITTTTSITLAMESIDVKTLEEAVSVFYRSGSQQQNASHTAAHEWLTKAQISPQAWSFVWELMQLGKVSVWLRCGCDNFYIYFCSLVVQSSEIQFFGATTLHTKLMKHWHEVPEENHDELKQKLFQTIILFGNGPKIVLNRLCIAVSGMRRSWRPPAQCTNNSILTFFSWALSSYTW